MVAKPQSIAAVLAAAPDPPIDPALAAQQKQQLLPQPPPQRKRRTLHSEGGLLEQMVANAVRDKEMRDSRPPLERVAAPATKLKNRRIDTMFDIFRSACLKEE